MAVLPKQKRFGLPYRPSSAGVSNIGRVGRGPAARSESIHSFPSNVRNPRNPRGRPHKMARRTNTSSTTGWSNHKNNNAIFDNDVLVGSILSFLPLSYRFTAVVNWRFRQCYLLIHNGQTTTSFQQCIYTVAAAQIWLVETYHADGSLPIDWPCNVAVQFGRSEVLQYLKE
jgi:hypothetical protein